MIIKLAGEQKSNDSWGLENYFVSETSNSFSESAKENIGDFSPKRESKLMISGYLAKRSWCLENQQTIRYLQSFSNLYMNDTRFWEYPFVFTNIKGRSQSKIIDIGCGQGTFAKILSMQGHRVIGVDNYESCWKDMENDLTKTGLRFANSDARDLKEFSDGEFDIALLISVIEHIPSNTIYCEKNRVPKTAAMLAAENPAKLAAISEALRVLKPNGLLIMTSDLYLDYPMDMNISWHELLGLEGLDIKDVSDARDLFISDNQIHKGRIMPVGFIIEKQESTEVSSFIMIDGFLTQGGEYFWFSGI
jgi:SAM-dependent methyltransferase